MQPALDLLKVKTILEIDTERINFLFDGYIDKKERLMSLLQGVQTEFNYLRWAVLLSVSHRLGVLLSHFFIFAGFSRTFILKPGICFLGYGDCSFIRHTFAIEHTPSEKPILPKIKVTYPQSKAII